MKREYFGMLITLGFLILLLSAAHFIGKETVKEFLYIFSPFLILLIFRVGQYSMRFPKAF